MYECEWIDMNCTVYGSKCKAPIHTLDPQAIHSHDPYIPKGYDPYPWSKTVNLYLYLRNKSGSNLLYDLIRNSLVPYFRIPVERSIHIHSIPLFLSHTQNIPKYNCIILYYFKLYCIELSCNFCSAFALCPRPRWKFALVSGPWPWMTLPLCCRMHCLNWWHCTRPSKQRVNSWRMCLGNSWPTPKRVMNWVMKQWDFVDIVGRSQEKITGRSGSFGVFAVLVVHMSIFLPHSKYFVC